MIFRSRCRLPCPGDRSTHVPLPFVMVLMFPPSTSPAMPHNADGSWLIPRTIHHIWLGGPLPQAYARLRESWLSRHEGWTARLWGDEDVDAFGLENREAYDAAGNFGEKSDILRYEVGWGLLLACVFLCFERWLISSP